MYQPRDGHQATGPDPLDDGWDDQGVVCAAWLGAVRGGLANQSVRWCMGKEFYRVIRTARLHSLRSFHLRPIDVVVFHDP